MRNELWDNPRLRQRLVFIQTHLDNRRAHTLPFTIDLVMNKVETAYLLWLGFFFGINGIHRLYNGKVVSGLLWLFTFGLFGIGQLIDLALIPSMVESHNYHYKRRHGLLPADPHSHRPVVETVLPSQNANAVATLTGHQLMVELIKAAQAKGGELSVTQGVIATGAPFKDVETALKDMLKSGYVGIDNDPDTGVILYKFKEL